MPTTLSWPAGFPYPQRADFGVSVPDLTQRSSFANGARVRPLYTDGNDAIGASAVLSLPQWAYLQGWHRYVLQQGSQWFLMPLLTAGVLETREVRFITSQPLSFSIMGVKFVRVKLALETRTGTAPSADTFEALGAFPDLDTLGADLQALEDFVNT